MKRGMFFDPLTQRCKNWPPPPPNNPAPEEPRPLPQGYRDPVVDMVAAAGARTFPPRGIPGLSDEEKARLINTVGGLCLAGLDAAAQTQPRTRDRSDEKKLAYRNPGEGEHPSALATGFYPRDSNANQTVRNHVRLGSRIDTQFISLTKSLEVARKYQDPDKGPIYIVNLNKVVGTVIDLTVPSVLDTYIQPNDIVTRRYATASKEVLVLGYIPPNAIEGTIGFMEPAP